MMQRLYTVDGNRFASEMVNSELFLYIRKIKLASEYQMVYKGRIRLTRYNKAFSKCLQ